MGRSYKNAFHATAAAALTLLCAAAMAQDVAPAAPPTCKFCPFDEGWSGQIELGLWILSGDAYSFGDYTGLDDDGLFAIADASARWRQDDGAGYWDVDARDLGLDARSIEVRGGQQGLFDVYVGYDNVPRRINDSARTPFLGSGGPTLSLPDGWITAASTQQMPELQDSLRPLELRQDRERFVASFGLVHSARWDTALTVRHDVRDGVKPVGASFITLASVLPQPVDAQTDQIELSTSLTGKQWQAAAGYYASFFRNDNPALTWDTPYNPLTDGSSTGRLALAPDNQFHQLSVTAGYRPASSVRLTSHLSAGRMFQDERFVATSTDAELATPLPRRSLDGQVDTVAARLRANAGPWAGLRLRAEYTYDDRNNRTPRDSYEPVVTDVLVADARSNLPYDFTRQKTGLGMNYRLLSWARLSLDWDQDRRTRSLQARQRTDEWTLRSRLHVQPPLPLSVNVGYLHADRSGSNALPSPAGTPADNPQLRAFHLANRVRDAATLGVGTGVGDWLSVDVNGSYGRDRYPDTDIGLERRRSFGYGADVALRPLDKLSAVAFWSYDDLDARQSGSQRFEFPDWEAQTRDRASVAGLRLEATDLWRRCDVGAEYQYLRTRGRTAVRAGTTDPGFPELAIRRQETRVYALYRARPRVGLRLEYRYADYRSSDWALTDVAPDTIHNLLSLGQGSPVYHANLIGLSARYDFE